MTLFDDLAQDCEWHLNNLGGRESVGEIEAAEWMRRDLLPAIVQLRDAANTPEQRLVEETERQRRMLADLTKLIECQHDDRVGFDEIYDLIRSWLSGEAQRTALACSHAKRGLLLELAKWENDAAAKTLQLQAEVDMLRTMMAEREQALRAIRNRAIDQVGSN